MKIDEAIRHLTELQYHDFIRQDGCYKKAIPLGIEALKRIKRLRDKKFPVMGEELPGETK